MTENFILFNYPSNIGANFKILIMHGHLSAQFQHAKRMELILFIWIQITGGSFILYKLSKIHFGPLSKGMSLAVRQFDPKS